MPRFAPFRLATRLCRGALVVIAMIACRNGEAVQMFNQPFTSSNSISSYYNATTPDSTTQFNDISAQPDGGTWSINGSHQLQLVRTGSSNSDIGAGISRWTPFLGPPGFLKMTFGFGLSGITSDRASAMVLDFGNYLTMVPYDSDTAAVLNFNRLTVDVGKTPSSMRFTIGSNSSAYYPADGTMYMMTYYLNASGSTQSYVAPDGSNQTISNNSVSLWLNTTALFNNVARSGTNASVATMRMRWGISDTGTWKISNITMDNGLTNNGVTGKIPLDPSMVVQEEAHGNAGLLVDEQSVAGDPANGLGGAPVNIWVPGPGSNSWYYPAHTIIDLGGTYQLTHIDVFNPSTSGTLKVYPGSPFNWGNSLFTDSLNKAGKWTDHAVNVQTRYLRLQDSSAASIPPEIVVYGSIVGSPITPPTPTIITPPSMENFMGVNCSFNDPVNRIAAVGVAREYHHWSWDEGDGVANYPGYPNNQNAFNPNGWGWNFDQFYINMHNLGIVGFPCVQQGVPWMNNGNVGAPPVYTGADPTLPTSYAAHADHLYQMAARYGAVTVATNKLKVSPLNSPLTGLNALQYYENWNEQDPWWNGSADWFSPYVFAAMSSADYDGHQQTMGTTVGIKNADPNAKLVMGGLANPNIDYVKAMKIWSDYYRGGSFPADVINLHIYATDGTAQTSATTGISPEQFGLQQQVQVFRTYRDQYLPGKEVWVTEFGYDTNPGSPFAAPAIGTFSNDEVQGQWLIRSYLALAAAGIDRATVFVMADSDENDTTQFATSGLVRSAAVGWTPKPSWFYIATMKNRLTGLHFYAQPSSGNPNVMIEQFADSGNNVKAYAIWCPTSNQTTVSNYSLALAGSPSSATLITLTDGNINGVASPLTISGGAVTINVSEKPAFVITGTLAPEVVPDQKVALSPSMVTNEAGIANAGTLVDEQALAGDPDNNNGGNPVTSWVPGYQNNTYPASAYIDLGQMTALTKIYLYDGANQGGCTISIGSPGNWTPIITNQLMQFDVWEPYVLPPGTMTRYVRYTTASSNSNMNEIVLYKKGTASGGGPIMTVQDFRTAAGLAADGSQDGSSAAHDNVPNLLKFAFNMTSNNYADIATYNRLVMTSNGIAGLPLIQANGSGYLMITYVRRQIGTNPGITYIPQVSSDLTGPWSALTTTPTITPIDSIWERVIYTDDVSFSSAQKRFIRIQVTSP